MPMNTTLVNLSPVSLSPVNLSPDSRSPADPPPSSRRLTAAARTCSRISAVLRLRVSPPCPVAQNGQAIPQPACEEMHTVLRSG